MPKTAIFAMTFCCFLGLAGCTEETLPPPQPQKPAVEYLTARQNEVMHAPNFTYELNTPDFTQAFLAHS